MDALEEQRKLIDALARSLEAGAGLVERFETHISWVLVAGGHAYKLKKALRLPFLDCSTLAARRFYCQEECRLNRRLAPALYIDVVPVGGDPADPFIGAKGTPLDYAVRMRAFDQDALWSRRLARGLLDGAEVDRLAAMLAVFHQSAAGAPAGATWGTMQTVAAAVDATLAVLDGELAQAEGSAAQSARGDLAAVREWEVQRRNVLAGLFAVRKREGMVRECHGDLHCSNVLTANDEVQVFDCIEFDDSLRWIDVMDELAFIHMDLAFRGRPDLAARLLSRYLESSGDYAGLALLRYYRMHRALVRAKVMLLRARQPGMSAPESESCQREGLAYIGFARESMRGAPAAVLAMHGFSGSGKTTAARMLVELLGAVQLRSDVERKRLHAVAPADADMQSLYGDAATRRTYARLVQLAGEVLAAGWPVVVDAACLLAAQRACLRELAADMGVAFLIVDLRAERASMLARIAARRQAGQDASDAVAAVLDSQLGSMDPLSAQELAETVVIDSGADFAGLRAACASVGAELARRGAGEGKEWPAPAARTAMAPSAGPACPPLTPAKLLRSFSFCTGIENSAPVIVGADGRPCRIDQMLASGHDRRWRDDFRLVQELGLRCLRYGPPYHRTHTGPGCYDWRFADEAFGELRRLGIVPIADLCHFGLPAWLENFQNPDFPAYFAEYATAFARRYPWIWLYTPVNEMQVTAEYSALRGYWNEGLRSDRAFVTALGNVVEANIRASEALLRVCSPWFVQSEATRYYHPYDPDAAASAEYLNERRFLSLDLNYGRGPSERMVGYLLDNGMSRSKLDYFLQRKIWPSCIMGTDYYESSESVVFADGSTRGSNVLGYYGLTRQYYERYRLPIMHTETNQVQGLNAAFWLERQWANVLRLRQEGFPIIGFTWYSLTDQVDWDIDLRAQHHHVVANGLYDLERRIRRAGVEFKRIIHAWSGELADRALPACVPSWLGEPEPASPVGQVAP